MNFTKKYFISLSIVVLTVILGHAIIPKSSSIAPTDFSQTPTQDATAPISTSDSSPPSSLSSKTSVSSKYKNGSYTGSVEDASYGNVQVKLTISGGKITNVAVLQYPNDNGTSARINSYAVPRLQSEVISAQSANINAISGASFTSEAFYQSVTSALAKAS